MIRRSDDYLKCKILANTDRTGSCWIWLKSLGSHGYGNIATGGGANEAAHRVSYEVFCGEIPAGSVVMHTCNNKKCCNPGHLSLGTQSENMSDAFVAKPRSAPMTRATRDYVRGSTKTTQELSDELGIRYCVLWKLRAGHSFRGDLIDG